jgi:hypothetical protein
MEEPEKFCSCPRVFLERRRVSWCLLEFQCWCWLTKRHDTTENGQSHANGHQWVARIGSRHGAAGQQRASWSTHGHGTLRLCTLVRLCRVSTLVGVWRGGGVLRWRLALRYCLLCPQPSLTHILHRTGFLSEFPSYPNKPSGKRCWACRARPRPSSLDQS